MKNEIKKIILEWQMQRIENPIKRQGNLVFSEEINTVIGLRRSGKTYFLFSQIESLIQNGIDPNRIVYINFDDERLAEIEGKQLHWIIEAYYELYPGNTNKNIYLFFDEIQDIDNWHLFIKRLYEQKKFHIVITGSSSRLLSKEIATELRGRSLTIKFFPLNFSEFLAFKNFPLIENIEFSPERFQLINYASEFLTYGGFPRVTMEPSHQRKKELLTDYLDMIIFKDIVERYDVRNTHLLRATIHYLLANFAAEFSVNNFLKKFRKEYQPNKVTTLNYFSYLEDVGFFHYLPLFSYKIHQRYLSKKAYIGDNGFIMLLSFRGMEVPGRLLENLIFTELLKRGKQVFYFKNAQSFECDFIITEAEKATEAIQVTYHLNRDNTERELRGLKSALKELGLKKGTIITADNEDEITDTNHHISIIPYWKWLIKPWVV